MLSPRLRCTQGQRKLRLESLEPRLALTAFSDLPQVFAPLADAYIQDAAATDNTQLVVDSQGTASDAYLRFNVTGFGGTAIDRATVRLLATSAVASADLELYRGGFQTWTEQGLTPSSAPSVGVLLDTFSGSVSAGEWVEFDISSAVLGNGSFNFVLRSAGGQVEFSARESANPAELIVVPAAAAQAGDFNSDGVVNSIDYAVYRETLGSTSDLRADASGNSIIDSDDYDLWRANYGAQAASPVAASVGDYGALADDEVYDHAAIQQALDENASVFLPAGEYWIDEKLVIPKGRRLFGPAEGAQAVIRVRHDTENPSNNFAIEISGANVTLQNFVIDKDFVDGSYGTGVYAENRDNLSIFGLEIQDYSVRYGIHFVELANFEIDSVHVHSFMMNQSGASAADMIQDSPAGVRITRSTGGSITNSKINDIEVGPLGRESISELVPGYGPQSYQSDGITLSDSSQILVENNNIWNSGELIDLLVSDNITVKDNVMQMAWGFAVKVIGSQNSVIENNYIADGAIGLWMGDHNTGSQATGNLVQNNDFVNNGSTGIYGETADSRLPFAISAVYVDNDADGNTVIDNDVYDFHGYLYPPVAIRTGDGSNAFSGNETILSEFGPIGGPDATIIGEWTAGLTHEKELIEKNRALAFFTYAEDNSSDYSATSVTYGGRSMTKLNDRIITVGGAHIYVSAWLLLQDQINMAADAAFNVTWNAVPDNAGYSSVFVANVYQPTPIFSEDTGAQNGGNHIQSGPRATNAGDLLLTAIAGGNPGEFTMANGFVEALEIDIPGADGVGAYKQATGSDDFGSATHTSLGGGTIYTGTLRRNPAQPPGSISVDVTTLGALPNDGVNDAIIVQAALNNSTYGEVYFPPGTYHFDRTVFLPSNKTVSGDELGVSRIEALGDIVVFRVDNNRVNATIKDFTIDRPQTQDSDHEIIRTDNATGVLISDIQISNSGSRAPMILVRGGSNNTVTRSVIVDYQTVRFEPSLQVPGGNPQIFGAGVTFEGSTNATITDNEVIQTFIPNAGAYPDNAYYQSSAYVLSGTDGGTVSGNYALLSGQGIDTSGSSNLTLSGNYIDQMWGFGIKTINGGDQILIEDNYIVRSGIAGIVLGAAGAAGEGGSTNVTVRNNTLVSIGKGVAEGVWTNGFGNSAPAAVLLGGAQTLGDRVQNNTITGNRSYDNDLLLGMVAIEAVNGNQVYPAINNTITDNIPEAGSAPAPPFSPSSLEEAFAELFADWEAIYNRKG